MVCIAIAAFSPDEGVVNRLSDPGRKTTGQGRRTSGALGTSSLPQRGATFC
jgi:hypothetical protein